MSQGQTIAKSAGRSMTKEYRKHRPDRRQSSSVLRKPLPQSPQDKELNPEVSPEALQYNPSRRQNDARRNQGQPQDDRVEGWMVGMKQDAEGVTSVSRADKPREEQTADFFSISPRSAP